MKNQPLLLAVIFLTTLAGHIATADAHVELVGQWDSFYGCYNVVVEGQLAYLGCGSELDIVDVSWPSNPTQVGWVWLPSGIEDEHEVEWVRTSVEHVAVHGNYAYVATEVGGERWDWWSSEEPELVFFSEWNFDIVDISNPRLPIHVGSENFTTFYGMEILDIAVASGSYAYVANGFSGLQIIDVSNPAAPYWVGRYLTIDPRRWASGVAVLDRYAYLTYTGSYGEKGLLIIDVSNPTQPICVGECDTLGPGSGYVCDVAVSGSYAYVANGFSGLQIIDVSNPAAPISVGGCDTSGWAEDVEVSGSYAYVADWGAGVQIIDVSNPAAPICVDGYDTPGYACDVAVSGGYIYVADGDALLVLRVRSFTEKAFRESTLGEALISSEAVMNDVNVTGDFESTLDFTGFEIVSIATGSWAGKGFSKGQWTTTLDGIPYTGDWQGVLFTKPEEGNIYLKGAVSGEITATVEGYLTESVPDSNDYDQYQATWKIGRLRDITTSATIRLSGILTYQNSSEFPATSLYILQSSIDGTVSGPYAGPLNAVINHIRIADANNPYWGQGFSIISYVSNSGSGQGWTYDKVSSPGIVKLEGLFDSPLFGIASGTLDESQLPRKLSLSVSRIDLGLPPAPDLKVKTWGPTRVSPGQTIDYIIEYRNDGLKTSDNAMLFASPDSLLSYISATAGANYDNYYHQLLWNIGKVLPKTSKYRSVTVEVVWGLPLGTTLTNHAYIAESGNNVQGQTQATYQENQLNLNSSSDKILYVSGVGGGEDTYCWDIASIFQFEESVATDKEVVWVPTYYTGKAFHLWDDCDVRHVDYATPYLIRAVDVPLFVAQGYTVVDSPQSDAKFIFKKTEQNGLMKQEIFDAFYDVAYSHSAGTRTTVTAILYGNLGCNKLVLISPATGLAGQETFKWELSEIHKKYPQMEIIIYQGEKDKPHLWSDKIWQVKFEADENSWLNENNIKVSGINLYDDENKLVNADNVTHGYFPLWVMLGELNKLKQQASTAPSIVAVAHDPTIKYGPEGRVSPGQRLDYKVEYENEGEGIAFGVYFTDTLDEDLNDSTLEIGPVIDVNSGVQIAPPGTYSPATRTISWFAGEVGPGQGGYTDFNVCVKSDAADGTEIINYATIYFPSVPEETRTNGIVSIVSLNQPPVANAGQDQTVYAWIDGKAKVTLDGSDSNDPDGDALTYKWTWSLNGQVFEANGVDPTIELPVGVHTIQLVVNDGLADSAADDVNVTVIAPVQGNLCVMPSTINRRSNQPHILAAIELDNIAKSDINADEPLTLYPGGIKATKQWLITCKDRRGRLKTTIFAFFDKDALMAAVPQNGVTPLKVAGKLKSGQYFYGCDTVRIIDWKWQWPWCQW